MTKVKTKKAIVSLLCACALLFAVMLAFAGGGIFTQAADEESDSLILQSIALSDEYSIQYKKFAVEPTVTTGTITATVKDGEDGAAETKTISWDEVVIERPDTTESGDTTVTVKYTLNGVTKEIADVNATVSDEVTNTHIVGVNYGTNGWTNNHRAITFSTDDAHAYDGLNICDGVGKYPSVNPNKTIADSVLVKFTNKDEPIPCSDLTDLVVSFWAGSFVMRPLRNYEADSEYGKVQYIIVKAGFIWYKNTGKDNWGMTNPSLDLYTPVANLVVTEDMYVAYMPGGQAQDCKQVKPIKKLEVSLSDEAQTEYYLGEPLNLTGITYSAEFLDPNEPSVKDAPVTADMCSAMPEDEQDSGEWDITVTLNGATAEFTITVQEAPATFVSLALKEDTELRYKKYSVVPEEGAKAIATLTCDTPFGGYEEGEEFTVEIDIDDSIIISRCDTTASGEKEVTISYKLYGQVKTATVSATVLDEAVTSNILGANYGASAIVVNGHYGVNFSTVAGGNDGLKAIDGIAGLESANPGVTLGDLVEIKFAKKSQAMTLTNLMAELEEANASKADADKVWIYPSFYGGLLALRDVPKLDKNIYGELEYVIIRAGFVWYKAPADTWGKGNSADTSSYYAVPSNVVTKDIYVGYYNDVLVNPIGSIEAVLPDGHKTTYMQNEAFNVKGVTLTVNYLDGVTESDTVELTAEMCGEIIGNGNSAQVEITYMNKTCVVNGLTLTDETVTGIEVTTVGKTEYSFPMDVFDISDYVISMIVENSDNAVRKQAIDFENIIISGFDDHNLGEQTVTFTYGEFTATQKITTVNTEPDKHLSIDYISNYTSYEPQNQKGLLINIGFEGMGAPALKVFWAGQKLDNVANKIRITYSNPDGTEESKLASELIELGMLDSVRFWSNQIILYFTDSSLQGSKSNEKYEEGVSALVEKVTFLPGFQFYGTPRDIWGQSWTMDDITLIEHAVIKEEITLVNVGYGMAWVRELKTDENGSLASDAVTIGSMPNKTTFTVGEKISASDLLPGLSLHFKYADGGEEDITPATTDIEFDNNITSVAGKKTVTVYFKSNEYYATFEIEVVEAPAESEDEGCGCSGNVISGSLIAAAVCLFGVMVAITFARKKENN